MGSTYKEIGLITTNDVLCNLYRENLHNFLTHCKHTKLVCQITYQFVVYDPAHESWSHSCNNSPTGQEMSALPSAEH